MGRNSGYYVLGSAQLLPAAQYLDWLGRIVWRYDKPDATKTPADPKRFWVEEPTGHSLTEVQAVWEKVKEQGVYSKLSGVGNLEKNNSVSATTNVSAKAIYCVRLPEYYDVFSKMREDPEVQKWLKSKLKPGGQEAWMIVSLLIWTDAEIIRSLDQASNTSGDMTFPTQSLLMAGAGTKLPGPSVGGSASLGVRQIMEARSHESMIFALEYVAIRTPAYTLFSRFSPRIGDFGPRVTGVGIMGPTSPVEDKKQDIPIEEDSEEQIEVDADTENSWTAGKSGLDIRDLDSISLVFGPSESNE